MTRYNGCGCGGHKHSGCNPCTSNNEIQQAVNDALALEKENLEQYENNAAQSATDAAKEAAKAAESASAGAQSQTNAETAASTATQAASSVTNTAVVLEETAERIEQAQDLLEEQISALQTKPVYFEVSTPTSSLVLPETESVFNVRSIYIASARQAVDYGFTFDKETRTVTLAEWITADQIAETEAGYILVEVICDVYSSDDPTSFPIILASNAGANNVGTSTGETVESRLTKLDSEVDPDLREDLALSDGLKLIGRCASVEVLRTIEPTQNTQTIRTISYHTGLAPEMPRGGGDYEYDPNDTATADDGILTIVTANGVRWKRVLQSLYLTCADAGVLPSGGDDTAALNSLFSKISSYRLTHGRFKLDMLGLYFESHNGNTIEFDPTRIELVNFDILNTLYTSTTAFAIVTCKPTLTFQSSASYVRGNVGKMIIRDATRHTDSPVTGLLLTSDYNGAFSCVVFDDLVITAPKNAIAFGNHCYLVTFNNPRITGYNGLTDSITAGLESTIVDSGENYVFNSPIFNGTQIFNWDNIEGEFSFVNGKADFVKGGINKRSGFVLDWIGGHIEFNNAYDKWFESSAVATVVFKPGRVVSVSGSATDFFYDSSADQQSLKVDFAPGSWSGNTVGALINTMLRHDTCASIQGFQPPVRGRLNKYLVDGKFAEASIVDGWYADANTSRTSRLVSDTTTLTRGTTINGAGATVGCLNVKKLDSVGAGFPSGAHLITRVPRGDTPAHIKFKYKATADTPVTVTIRLVSILSIDSNGVPTFGKRVITSSAVNLTATTTEKEYVSGTGLNVVADYQRYDYVQLSVSTFEAGTNSAQVSIYDVLLNKIG